METSTPDVGTQSYGARPEEAPIYLDYNATTPLSRETAEAMRPYLDQLWGTKERGMGGIASSECDNREGNTNVNIGNPSSSHYYGMKTKQGVEKARHQVASLIGSNPDEVVFTSGGTESNNYAIKGSAFSSRDNGNHIITTSIEHPAVLETVKYLELEGFKIGTIQPLAEIATIAHEYSPDILVHTDASQSIGKVPVIVKDLGVDLLTICPHKFYGPKGVGALCIRRKRILRQQQNINARQNQVTDIDIKRGVKLRKQMHGASHERDLRAGTENIILIAGLGMAAEVAKRDLVKNSNHMKDMRDRLVQILEPELVLRVNGHPTQRLPNTLNISFPHIYANTLLSEIGDRVAASAGAACHAETTTISHVLTAIAVPQEFVLGTIRLSTGKDTTAEDIDAAAAEIVRCVKKLSPKSDDATNNLQDLAIDAIRLTTSTHGLGCGCKMRPQALEEVLRGLPKCTDPNVLVGTDTSDDAGVYKITDDIALVQTVDFFTPVVDDAYTFGAIAAANSLSDVYAMGGVPKTALNIVAFPTFRLPLGVLNQILKGAYDKAAEAGVSILGGHTIDDSEPKFGLSVTGIVHPHKIWKNNTAQAGDTIILTKRIGTGICTTAMKRNLASPATATAAIRTMSQLNKYAAEILLQHTVHSCTDVTGFGLIGHLWEMAKSSSLSVNVYFDSIPLIEGTQDLAMAQVIPGGTMNNHQWLFDHVVYDKDVPQHLQYIVCDAQTSGGLMVSVPSNTADEVLKALRASPQVECAAVIGHFSTPQQEGNNGNIPVKIFVHSTKQV